DTGRIDQIVLHQRKRVVERIAFVTEQKIFDDEGADLVLDIVGHGRPFWRRLQGAETNVSDQSCAEAIPTKAALSRKPEIAPRRCLSSSFATARSLNRPAWAIDPADKSWAI